jgi:hypothetical protein
VHESIERVEPRRRHVSERDADGCVGKLGGAQRERIVRTRRLAIYAGCLGLLIGSAGLAYESFHRAQSTAPLFVDAGRVSVPVAADWPPDRSAWPADPSTAAVAFHDEMLELLTPRRSDSAGGDRTGSTQAPAAAQPSQEASVPPRETVREVTRGGNTERRQTRAERRRGNASAEPDARTEQYREPDRRAGNRYYYRSSRGADPYMDRASDRVARDRDVRTERDRDRDDRDDDVRLGRDRDIRFNRPREGEPYGAGPGFPLPFFGR